MPSASYLLTNASQPALTPRRLRFLTHSPAGSRTILTWLPIALFLGIFAMESTRAFGSDHTSAPLHNLFQILFGSALDENWAFLHHLIRKTGHFTAYGTFSLFAYQAAARTLRDRVASPLLRRQLSHTLAVAATLTAASADEIHQCFLPNRTGCVADVMLDTAGAVTLQLALVVLFHLARKHDSTPASFHDLNLDLSCERPDAVAA